MDGYNTAENGLYIDESTVRGFITGVVVTKGGGLRGKLKSGLSFVHCEQVVFQVFTLYTILSKQGEFKGERCYQIIIQILFRSMN